MERERIDELLRKNSLLKSEKEEIRAAADAAGIKYRIKADCSYRCYEGILLQLYEMDDPERNVSRDGWRLKSARCSFALQGRVISNANIKDIAVGKLHHVVRSTFFERVGDDGAEG